MARFVEAQISKAALLHNVAQVRKYAKKSKIWAMVKANAYGHGITRVAKILQNLDYLGVACIEEALSIRAVGVQTPIVLMEGIFRDEELPLVQKCHFNIVIHHIQQIEALKAFVPQYQHPIQVWLKINTGMNRLGFQLEEFQAAYNSVKTLPHVNIMGFMTHFACADELENKTTSVQIEKFLRAVADKPGLKSAANSAAIIAHPQSHFDIVRPGLMLYGASPFANKIGQDHDLKPVMHLTSEVIALQTLKPGDKVGYGGIWENKNNHGRIALIACGYGDGYPWQAKIGAPVLINGIKLKTCGRISMDIVAVDISHQPQIQVGDKVTLWGGALPIEEVARSAGTIPYELMCSYIERVPMRLVDSSTG